MCQQRLMKHQELHNKKNHYHWLLETLQFVTTCPEGSLRFSRLLYYFESVSLNQRTVRNIAELVPLWRRVCQCHILIQAFSFVLELPRVCSFGVGLVDCTELGEAGSNTSTLNTHQHPRGFQLQQARARKRWQLRMTNNNQQTGASIQCTRGLFKFLWPIKFALTKQVLNHRSSVRSFFKKSSIILNFFR